MITAASILAPILVSLDVNMILAAQGAAMGSLIFSYFNDSFFWGVNRLLGIKNVKEQILVWSVPTTLMWFTGLICLVIICVKYYSGILYRKNTSKKRENTLS